MNGDILGNSLAIDPLTGHALAGIVKGLMAWYDDVDHTTVASSIPSELIPWLDMRRGSLTRSRYIRGLIEADLAQMSMPELMGANDSESAA